MNRLHIELDIELEEELANIYQKASEDIKGQIKKNLDNLAKKQLLKLLKAVSEPKLENPWLDFLDNLEDYAVDTGIEDLSVNHEHYLYGGPKRK
jgi:hypothetical protein